MSDRIKFKGGDYLLLLLYADAQSPLLGRTRLQKIAFLFEKEILKQYRFDKEFEVSEVMEFKPYNYGPFSKKVFDFIVFFENLELLGISYEENPLTTSNKKMTANGLKRYRLRAKSNSCQLTN